MEWLWLFVGGSGGYILTRLAEWGWRTRRERPDTTLPELERRVEAYRAEVRDCQERVDRLHKRWAVRESREETAEVSTVPSTEISTGIPQAGGLTKDALRAILLQRKRG